MRYVSVFLIALVMALPAQAAEDFAKSVAAQSRYYGVGWQNDGQHWTIDLALGESDGTVAYPTVDCSGTWTLIKKNLARLEFIERITDGLDNCIPLGTVTLEPLPDGELLYTFWEHADRVDARGVLVPMGPSRLPYMTLLKKTLNTVSLDYMLPEFSE